MIYRAVRRNLPEPIVKFLRLSPNNEEKRFLGFATAAKRIAKGLFEGAKEDTDEAGTKGGKDILSVLVRSNSDADPTRALDEDEVLSQITCVQLVVSSLLNHCN